MKSENLVRDPVFQLNILIWMAKEQPLDGYRVRPLFFENDFRLVYIEQPYAFPDATARAIASSVLAPDITKAPEPEMILRRDADQKALYFEAKADSFSPESSNSRQARGHLLACGPAFAESLKPLRQCLLCYVVPQDGCEPMRTTLDSLTSELRSASLHTGEHSVHGLAVTGADLIYSWDEKFQQHSGVTGGSTAVLHELTDDTDPSPLLLVFTDEDCPNVERAGFYRKALINQVVARLVCDLNLLAIGKTYATTARDLLAQTTDGILQYVGRERQNKMIGMVRQTVFNRILSYWSAKNFTPVKLEAGRLEITFKDSLAKSEFMEWLEDAKRASFSDERPAIGQPGLPGFEQDEAGGQ